MIAFEQVYAEERPLALKALSLTLDRGVHALVGGRGDGPPLALALAAGRARPRAGRLRVVGSEPADAPARRAIGDVPLDAVLPDALKVAEALVLAAKLRKEDAQDPEARLAALGVEALASRRGSSSPPTRRAQCVWPRR